MRNGSISLPIAKIAEQNKNGFITDESYKFMRGIRAEMKDATRSDQTIAQQFGYSADVIVSIKACNYNGESFFIDDATGMRYDIKRTYRHPGKMTIELTGERKEHHEF